MLRWQHTLGATWRLGATTARLGLRHKSGYADQNSPSIVVGGPAFYGRVDAYTLLDASVTTRWLKNLSLTLGVRNLLDTDPPFSNQANRSQRGFEPRFTDPLGRSVFVRASYSFGG